MEAADDNLAIPFINFTDKFEVDIRAKEYLSKFDSEIGIIAICGKYRTGKSYLLNRIMQFEGEECPEKLKHIVDDSKTKGFKVGSTTNACTKGLWLLKKPIFIQNRDNDDQIMPVLIIDTEGLCATDQNVDHDTKIFVLAILLSSMLIYNSVGTIDENALNTLQLVVQIANQLKFKNNETELQKEELAKQFPSLLWVLRDFSLRLIDEDGSKIKAKDYLEDKGLAELKGHSDMIHQKNMIRKSIKYFFQKRDCATLVRPMENESDLQKLDIYEDSNLRPEFVSQLNILKNKIFNTVRPKKLDDKIINGRMLVELAEAYSDAFNKGSFPTIENAWNYMLQEETENALKASFEYINDRTQRIIESLPMNENDLISIKDALCTEAQQILSNKLMHGTEPEVKVEYMSKVENYNNEQFSEINNKNLEVTSELVKEYFETHFKQNVRRNLNNEKYHSIDDYEKDLHTFKEKFDKKFKDSQYSKCLKDILNKFNEKVYQEISALKTRKLELELVVYEERRKHAESELSKVREDFEAERKRLNDRNDLLKDELHKHMSNAMFYEK